jgi:ribosomal-protein-alanine N-acetyltransferase
MKTERLHQLNNKTSQTESTRITMVDLSVNTLETERLLIRQFTLSDASFIFALVNQSSFVENIRDFGVKNLADAELYLTNGPLKSYATFGFGLNFVALKDGTPIGMCGLIKRDTLPDVDIGFGFLSSHSSKGYATEAASAVLKHGFERFNLPKILAITNPNNHGSISVVTKLGFTYDGLIKPTPEGADLKLFSLVRA